MANETIDSKAGLLEQIETTWPVLDRLLNRLTEGQLTSLRDKEGWSIKDHIIHLAAWEDSVTALFEGQPRHQGLGIDQATYSTASFDEINALIQERHKDDTLQQALAHLRASHKSLMAGLERLSDADLKKPARELFPAVPVGDRRRMIDIIYENTAEHFEEHRGWIETLAASG